MIRIVRALLAATIGCLFSPALWAQENTTEDGRAVYDLPLIKQAAVIDGVMNETHWQQALIVTMDIETAPDENTPARQKTTAYLYENGESLFVAFRAEDDAAQNIRAYLRDRDDAWDDDFVGLQLDTFNDEQRAYEFFVNPYGAQMDLLYDEVSRNDNSTWDAIWDSAGQVDDKGFTVEMEIPFSNLRFEDNASAKTWGFELLRSYPRDQRRSFRNSPRDRNRNCVLCQFHKLRGFEQARQGNQLELNPVLTIATSQSRVEGGGLESDGTDYEPGLNLKWGITPEFTLDATINPDFSQVEADSPQLGVNETFALFFEEKRPFFLEGNDYFQTNLNVVYTRNVTAPDVGMKLTGRTGKHTVGTFAVRDDVTNIIIPGTFGSDFTSLDDASDVFVGRYRYDFTPDSNIGAVATYRNAGDYSNSVVGIDAFYRWKDNHRLQMQYLTSSTDNTLEMQDEFDLAPDQSGDAVVLNYRFNSRDWFQYTTYRSTDENFRADMGFVTQNNNDFFVVGGGRIFYSETAWWNRLEWGGDWDIRHDKEGRVLEREIEMRLEGNGPMQSYFNVGAVVRDRLFDDIVFEEKLINTFANITPRRGLLFDLSMRFGDRIDFSNSRLGENFRFNPGIHYSINRHTQLLLHHDYDRLKVGGLRERVANLTDLVLKYQFNQRSFLRLTAQLQSIKSTSEALDDFGSVSRDRDFNKQLLYSYKLNPRTVFFLGYSDLVDSDDERPNLQTQQRGLFMKLGYVFDY